MCLCRLWRHSLTFYPLILLSPFFAFYFCCLLYASSFRCGFCCPFWYCDYNGLRSLFSLPHFPLSAAPAAVLTTFFLSVRFFLCSLAFLRFSFPFSFALQFFHFPEKDFLLIWPSITLCIFSVLFCFERENKVAEGQYISCNDWLMLVL